MAKETITRSDMNQDLRKFLGVDETLGSEPIVDGQHAVVEIKFDDRRMLNIKGDIHVVEAKALHSFLEGARAQARRGRKPKSEQAAAA